MTNPRLTFGQMTVFGELARGVHPADGTGLAMALALDRPDDPHPPFAIVPVLLDGSHIGDLRKIQFVWGGILYEFFELATQKTYCYDTAEIALQELSDRLQLAG
jgi:hypothetical protein